MKKKQVSPVVTVVVILVVVVIVVMLWMRFSNPPREAGAGGGGGIGIQAGPNPPDTSPEALERARADAAQESKKLEELTGASRGAGNKGETE